MTGGSTAVPARHRAVRAADGTTGPGSSAAAAGGASDLTVYTGGVRIHGGMSGERMIGSGAPGLSARCPPIVGPAPPGAPDARPLRVAVVTRPTDALSLRFMREHTVRELAALGVEIQALAPGAAPPRECDLVWEPALAGTRPPAGALQRVAGLPVVATAHGARAFVLPWTDVWPSRTRALLGQLGKRRALRAWRRFRRRAAAVVGVSDFGAREIGAVFGVAPDRLHRIYSGVDLSTFCPEGPRPPAPRPYFLWVARPTPVKNLDRVLEAYRRLAAPDRPELVLVTAGSSDVPARARIEGVRWLAEQLGTPELAGWYRGALGLVFPSLHEAFGHPVLEAMASGCPVITSNRSGCAEIAGPAALLVDPRDVAAITAGMRALLDPGRRAALRAGGLERARRFPWRATAQGYRALFREIVGAAEARPRARRR